MQLTSILVFGTIQNIAVALNDADGHSETMGGAGAHIVHQRGMWRTHLLRPRIS